MASARSIASPSRPDSSLRRDEFPVAAGDCRPPDRKLSFAPDSAFARDLRARLKTYREAHGGDRFAGIGQWLAAGAAAIVFVLAWGALIGFGAGLSWASLIGLSAALGASAFGLLVFIGHDAAHGSAARRAGVNDALVFGVFALLGVSGALWRDRHLRLHHVYPNLSGTGIDADASELVRLAPDKPRRWYHRLQPVYAWPLYAAGLAALIWIEDFQLFREMRRSRPRQFGGARSALAFAATKLLHLTLFVLMPLVAGGLGVGQVALLYVVSTGLASLAFAVLVIGTHVSDRAAFPEPGETGAVRHDWATHQLLTSIDWAPESRLAAALTGGANAHTAHHLFPGFAHSHAPALSRIVTEAAAAHGLPYRPTSFAGMVAGHLRQLVALSRPEPAATAPAGRRVRPLVATRRAELAT